MDLNVGSNELFENNDMVFPIQMGRENLKILVSPGSESSGVSSLDADEAKVSYEHGEKTKIYPMPGITV